MRAIAIFGFMLKLIIVILNLGTFMFFALVIIQDGNTLPSWIPAIIIHVGCSYITASMFCNYYEVVAYTLLMCLSVDNDLHNGSLEFGPSPFHEIVGRITKLNKVNKGYEKKKDNRDSDNMSTMSKPMLMPDENEGLF